MKYESESYKDRVESQEELHETLEKCFNEIIPNVNFIDYSQFLYIVENVCSDIYFFIYVFLLEKRPFSKTSLARYEKQTNSFLKVTTPILQPTSPSKLVASPNLKSKFSPSVTISKSPGLTARKSFEFNENMNTKESKDLLMKLAGKNDKGRIFGSVKVSGTVNFENNVSKLTTNIKDAKIPIVNRKLKTNLRTFETDKNNKTNHTETTIQPAVKQNTKSGFKNIPLENSLTTSMNEININEECTPKDINKNLYNSSDEEDLESNNCEGFLYKITDSKKLKKIFFKLYHRDLYYFKNENEVEHQGMHNLSGVFVKEEKPQIIEGNSYFTFSVTYPKKVRYYYVDNENDYDKWVSAVRKATGYSDLNEIYEVKEKIGNGKFGLVKLGIHKKTGRKVAIKIMNKKEMCNQDLELVKTEIEILKICSHPNIIRIYDVFENLDYFYISKDINLN
jgi:hypothetical protein